MRTRFLTRFLASLAALALPLAAAAEDDDPCQAHARATVEALEDGPSGGLSERERGLALAAAVRGCQSERMRIAEIAASAPAHEREGGAATASAASQPETGFLQGLRRWLQEPVECERIRRANGRIVSDCD